MTMKRLSALLLILTFLLCSCSDGHKFQRCEDGSGYIDTKTNVTYTLLDIAFEPGLTEETVGKYTDKKRDITVIFHAIPGLDPAYFLADEDRNVYYAGETPLDAATWQPPEAVLVCEGDAISVERIRFSSEIATEKETVTGIRDLWFDGEEANFLSIKEADKIYSIKLCTKEYPNLYYCFDFLYFEQGESYFYSATGHRSVVVPDDLVALLHVSGGEA